MANTQIDIAKTAQVKDITDSATGTVTNDVRVIIAADTTTLEAVVSLQNIIAALVSDQITIQTS
jgi:hypothetical protein